MAEWLSREWGSAAAEAAGEAWSGAGRAPVVLSVTVTGAPGGEVTGTATLWAGGDGARREVALTLPAADARAVLEGELAPSVAFMRGRMKTAGDPGAVLEVLEVTATPGWDGHRVRMAAATERTT